MRTFRFRFSSRGFKKLIPVSFEGRSLNKGIEGEGGVVRLGSTELLQEKNRGN
jgi:hypothetical protein